MTELTVDELRVCSEELRHRDPGFLRIVSVNVAEGQGEYEVRSATTGATLRRVFTFEGTRILSRVSTRQRGSGSRPQRQPRRIRMLRASRN